MYDDLKGKVALVTASSRGIAFAAVKMLAADGATVYMGIRAPEKSKQAVEELNAAGGNVHIVYFDGDDFSTFAPMVDTVIAQEGRIDILINSLGGYPSTSSAYIKGDKSVLDSTVLAINGVLEHNIAVTAEVCRLVIPHMIQNGGGSIVNNASLTAFQPQDNQTYYGMAKMGVVYLTRAIAAQYGRYGIRCNAVCPGFTKTEAAMRYMPKESIDAWLKHTPIYRLGEPEDQAKAMLFFASEQSSWITGQALEVAGGHGVPCPAYGDEMDALGLNPATNPDFQAVFGK